MKASGLRSSLFFAFLYLFFVCGWSSCGLAHLTDARRDAWQPAAAQQALDALRYAHLKDKFALSLRFQGQGPRSTAPAYYGQLYGQGQTGLTLRLDLEPVRKKRSDLSQHNHWLIQQGPQPAVFVSEALQNGKELHMDKWLAPIAQGLVYAPFDLLMPFIYWPSRYIETQRYANRLLHLYEITPPPAWANLHPDHQHIRLYIDSQLHILMKAECLDAQHQITRTIKVESFKKAHQQWVIKTIEVKDHIHSNKTQLCIEAAALNVRFDDHLLSLPALSRPLPPLLQDTYHAL